MTELSDKLLVAYVDGQLARKQNRAVEKVLEQDDVSAARAKALQEGRSRLEAAFDAILAGEASEISALTTLIKSRKDRVRSGLAKAGMAGIVISVLAAAASYGWPPFIAYEPALRDTPPPQEIPNEPRVSVEESSPKAEPQFSAATPAVDALENSKHALDEEIERADRQDFVANREQHQVQADTHAADVQRGSDTVESDSKVSGTQTQIAVPANEGGYAGVSQADRPSPPAETPATPVSDETAPSPEAAEHKSETEPLEQVAHDEPLHPKTGTGEPVTDEQQPAQHPSQSSLGRTDFESKLADSEITGAVAGDDGISHSDRTSLTAETPSVEPATPAPAAEAPDSNSGTLPKKMAGKETLDPKTAGGGVVAKGATAEQSTENQLDAAHAQQSLALPATKSLTNEKASASAKKPLARQVKPAAPRLRLGAKRKETASKSRSKPFTLGTAGGLLPGKVSNRRASAGDYATRVRQALGRHTPRSAGTRGSVTMSFTIGANGALRSARISRSSGKAQLDRAALAIVRRAAPFPRPPRGGQPGYTITINFR